MRAALIIIVALAALAVAGCGGDDGDTTPAAGGDAKPQGLSGQGAEERESVESDDITRPGGPEIVIASLGDSITAGDPGFDPNPEDRATYGFGTNPQSQYQYWAMLEDPRLTFRNCGVFGERTDEIAQRLESCARGADVLIVQGGINDIAQSLSGADVDRIVAVDEAAENLRGMVRRGKSLGLEVQLTDVLPWNNGFPYAEPLIDRLNEMIEEIGAEEGVPVLPFHDVLEDPANPGLMAEDLTADGDHPSIAGYRRLGELAFRLPPR